MRPLAATAAASGTTVRGAVKACQLVSRAKRPMTTPNPLPTADGRRPTRRSRSRRRPHRPGGRPRGAPPREATASRHPAHPGRDEPGQIEPRRRRAGVGAGQVAHGVRGSREGQHPPDRRQHREEAPGRPARARAGTRVQLLEHQRGDHRDPRRQEVPQEEKRCVGRGRSSTGPGISTTTATALTATALTATAAGGNGGRTTDHRARRRRPVRSWTPSPPPGAGPTGTAG